CGTGDETGEDGASNAAACRADGTGNEASGRAYLCSSQRNRDRAGCARCRTYGTTNTARDMTRFDA
ncbi:conserved hypothetical protein, partial [Ricinus communis]